MNKIGKGVLIAASLMVLGPDGWTTQTNTRTNAFFSGVLGGAYATQAVEGIIEGIPLMKVLPIELFSLEEEASRFVRRESGRAYRKMVHTQMSTMGIRNLQLASSTRGHAEGAAKAKKARTRIEPPSAKLKAHVSTRRMSVTFLYRF